jgi:hypothetical protein
MKRSPIAACVFAAAGAIASVALWVMVGFGNAYSGWGDGATVRHTTSAASLVTPCAIYFACGVVASLSVTRWARSVCLVIAHVSPWFMLTAVHSSGDRGFLLGVIVVAFAVFAALWRSILRGESKAWPASGTNER